MSSFNKFNTLYKNKQKIFGFEPKISLFSLIYFFFCSLLSKKYGGFPGEKSYFLLS